MGAAVIGAALVGAALALPWLTLLPLHGAIASLAHAVTLVAALHGAGLVVARASGQRTASPWLLLWWGAAALLAASGIAIAARQGTLATHAVLVYGCVAIHTAALGLQFTRYAGRARDALAGPASWLVPAAALTVLGGLAVLAATSGGYAQPFDDDGHVLGQLRRVLDTGALGDAIGYPRRGQLGGQIALAALSSGASDGFARVFEPLAMALALGLAIARIGARDATGALWAVLLVVAAFALALAPLDPLPCWTAVGFCLTLYAMLGEAEPAPPLPLALTAGALATLRHELIPIAAVALVAAWWPRRADRRHTAWLALGALAAIAPLMIARWLAWRGLPAAAIAALPASPRVSWLARLALAAAIGGPVALVLRLALADSRAVRIAAVASGLALAGVVAKLTGQGTYPTRLLWPIAIAFALTLAIDLARTRWAGPSALLTSLLLCLLIAEGREAPGRLRWSRRWLALSSDLGALGELPSRDGPYRDLLAEVPAGARVALWVHHPEQLDHARHRFVDLRGPVTAPLRGNPWRSSPRLAALLDALGASYLLVEDDDMHVRRTQGEILYRLVCQDHPQTCPDDLAAVVARHQVVAARAGVRLIALTARRP